MDVEYLNDVRKALNNSEAALATKYDAYREAKHKHEILEQQIVKDLAKKEEYTFLRINRETLRKIDYYRAQR